MTRKCDVCGRSYMAKSPRSKTCGDACRQRKRRTPMSQPVGGDELNGRAPVESDELVEVTRAELEAAGRLDSVLGQQALRLAEQMCGFETGGGMAALSRELRATMAEATRGAAVAADPLDELKARRNAKRAG